MICIFNVHHSVEVSPAAALYWICSQCSLKQHNICQTHQAQLAFFFLPFPFPRRSFFSPPVSNCMFLFVCLSAGIMKKKLPNMFPQNIGEGVGHGPRRKPLHFGADPDEELFSHFLQPCEVFLIFSSICQGIHPWILIVCNLVRPDGI